MNQEGKQFDFDAFMDESAEPDVQMSAAVAAQTVLSFGCHKGEKLIDIASTPAGWAYLEYILTWDRLSPVTRKTVEFLMQWRGPPSCDIKTALEHVLQFGKHRGETLGSLCKTADGRTYLEHIQKWEGVRGETKLYVNTVVDAASRWASRGV